MLEEEKTRGLGTEKETGEFRLLLLIFFFSTKTHYKTGCLYTHKPHTTPNQGLTYTTPAPDTHTHKDRLCPHTDAPNVTLALQSPVLALA